jgi:hypothetical protein
MCGCEQRPRPATIRSRPRDRRTLSTVRQSAVASSSRSSRSRAQGRLTQNLMLRNRVATVVCILVSPLISSCSDTRLKGLIVDGGDCRAISARKRQQRVVQIRDLEPRFAFVRRSENHPNEMRATCSLLCIGYRPGSSYRCVCPTSPCYLLGFTCALLQGLANCEPSISTLLECDCLVVHEFHAPMMTTMSRIQRWRRRLTRPSSREIVSSPCLHILQEDLLVEHEKPARGRNGTIGE